jgi:ferritin-like metal-binding protein YciE
MDKKIMTSFLEKALRYIYEAEHQILEGLQTMTEKAVAPDLKKAFQRHEKETRNQIIRLDEVAHTLLIDYKADDTSTVKKALGKGKEIIKDIAHIGTSASKGGVIQSLIEEGKEMINRFQDIDSEILDLALANNCMQIEQTEIAAYNLLCHLAQKLDEPEALQLLQESLEEEKRMLSTLNEISDQELMQSKGKNKKIAAGYC